MDMQILIPATWGAAAGAVIGWLTRGAVERAALKTWEACTKLAEGRVKDAESKADVAELQAAGLHIKVQAERQFSEMMTERYCDAVARAVVAERTYVLRKDAESAAAPLLPKEDKWAAKRAVMKAELARETRGAAKKER